MKWNGIKLTRKRLKSLLKYDPSTGSWTWLVFRGGTAKKGSKAGCANTDGYIQICVDQKFYMASRLAFLYMKGRWPKFEMDHKDLNPANNAWCNLRPATDSQNQGNRRIQRNNTSGYPGVMKRGRYWYAVVWIKRKRHCNGGFSLREEAIVARKRLKFKLYGEFAGL